MRRNRQSTAAGRFHVHLIKRHEKLMLQFECRMQFGERFLIALSKKAVRVDADLCEDRKQTFTSYPKIGGNRFVACVTRALCRASIYCLSFVDVQIAVKAELERF